MRKPIIAGNWKMFKTLEESVAFVKELEHVVGGFADDHQVLDVLVLLQGHPAFCHFQ